MGALVDAIEAGANHLRVCAHPTICEGTDFARDTVSSLLPDPAALLESQMTQHSSVGYR